MATEAQTKSLSELERETENTRADLVDTVDKLHNRVSPQAIKEEVKAYAREASYDLIHNLERRARENPLQAVAVAAGLAYPAWRFMINIPAPILLVGAGLALTQMGASTRSMGSHERSGGGTDASSKLSDAVENLKEKSASALGEAKSAITSGVNALSARATAAITDAGGLDGRSWNKALDRPSDRWCRGIGIRGVLAAIGTNRLNANSLVPKRTLEQLNRDVTAAKEHI
jgi:ElaB/YqjD/DUF883 family membrane-anchored ribosome-binding protein